jgi:hypothetical protein
MVGGEGGEGVGEEDEDGGRRFKNWRVGEGVLPQPNLNRKRKLSCCCRFDVKKGQGGFVTKKEKKKERQIRIRSFFKTIS